MVETSKSNYIRRILTRKIQWMSLNGITLGITDRINRMITISKFISYAKYAIERHFGVFQSGSVWPHLLKDPINRNPFGGTHCTYVIVKLIIKRCSEKSIYSHCSHNKATEASNNIRDGFQKNTSFSNNDIFQSYIPLLWYYFKFEF